MDKCLISVKRKIWIKFEKISDDVSRIFFINGYNQEVPIPTSLIVHDDNKGMYVSPNVTDHYFYVSNYNNHSIYLNEEHILDFSHQSLWRI